MKLCKFIEFERIIDKYFLYIGEGSSLRAEATFRIWGVVSIFYPLSWIL